MELVKNLKYENVPCQSNQEVINNVQYYLEHTICMLVDFPESVSVVNAFSGSTAMFSIEVAKEDLGKIIGRQGRMADSLRLIIMGMLSKYKIRGVIEIVDLSR